MQNSRYKFRAWDKKDKKMLKDWEGEYSLIEHFGFNGGDRFIVQQSVGLKDKNGKEIFENDILEHPEYGNCKVIYRYGGFGIEAKTSSWINTGFHSFSTRSADYEHCEVLGNLYENSNLLLQDK